MPFDDLGDDVVMRQDNADEDRAGPSSLSGSDVRRRITTKTPREDKDVLTSTTEQHVPRKISGKTRPSEHTVAVTTQEAPNGHREKTMRIASVENIALDWGVDIIGRDARFDTW